ncbi:alkaline phosphatase D family protein [Corynebacterium sp.]|uniref:alkaline phosphatase D family protein n=1 Tax=Corynebacterium sp. TaxID=1720 RepID=UPI003735BE01
MRWLQRKKISRRHLLRGITGTSVVAGAAVALPISERKSQLVGRASASPPAPHYTFMHGVASGDPLPTSVILWTRVTPEPGAYPGSNLGPATEVAWEVATDPDFHTIVRAGSLMTSVTADHTVHVDPFGLEPATTYFYRFHALGETSPVGTTRTAPAADATPEQLSLAVCSCANMESGYFQAYQDIADNAAHFDAVVHMGDYLYEFASGEYTGKHGITRPHEPRNALVTLSDYRQRYGAYRRDPSLQAAHAALPWVVTWDDHEIADNAWSGGASNHGEGQGDWAARRAAAMQAYLEWLPVRGGAPSEGGHIYRTLSFGQLADLHMLDLRSYRSAPGVFHPAQRGDTERTIMGAEQFQWLRQRLESSTARWDVIGTSVMMAPLNLNPLDIGIAGVVADMVGMDAAGTPVNLDQWDGYEADRLKLLSALEGHTLFLTGDIHSEWANEIHHAGRTVAAELVCSSISAANVDDVLGLPQGSPVSRAAERVVCGHNPHVKHVNLDVHGYASVRIDEHSCQMTWWRVEDVERSGAAVHQGPTLSYDGASLG